MVCAILNIDFSAYNSIESGFCCSGDMAIFICIFKQCISSVDFPGVHSVTAGVEEN